MLKLLSTLAFICLVNISLSQKTIHVFVALCDNQYQGIVPVPAKIGNGQNPASNLYWGAGYGVKNFFKVKSADWTLVRNIPSTDPMVLERLLFKHKSENAFLLADAYDGRHIKSCIESFLLCSNDQKPIQVSYGEEHLHFGGAADLLAYVGHNGLMDFEVNPTLNRHTGTPKEVMILCCYAKQYFGDQLKQANAIPVLWTTHLMAPEAYTLAAAIKQWLKGASNKEIESAAEITYQRYQNCSMSGARNLFQTGF